MEGITGDTLIKTNLGFKEVKNIKNGDLVQVLDSSFQPVINILSTNINQEIREINSRNYDTNECFTIKCTNNCKFLISEQNPDSMEFSNFNYKYAEDIIPHSSIKMGDRSCFPSDNDTTHYIGLQNNNPINYSGEIYKLIFDRDYSYTTSLGIVV